jgi:VWFA-related protein
MDRCASLAVACACLLGTAGQAPTFRSAARTVEIYATVQGKDGRLIPDLTRDDFQIFDNGNRQPITVFDNTEQKITVAALFDMSNSMADDYPRIRAAAGALVNALWPDDRARIGSFGAEVALSPFLTGDKKTLQRILDEELWPGGPTPLWYATDRAMTALEAEQGRRVVLLLTDGEDASLALRATRDEVHKHAERGGFTIYAVGLPGQGLSDALSTLVDDTGGGRVLVDYKEDLGAAFTRVVDELHHQYSLGFSMATADGKTHSVSIKVNRGGAKVRARKSYVATAAGSQ